ncbi:hypothetical protein SAMN05421823_107144 [Catalinimonas alkaloidigena]|uniref:Uncharacterized protein n=1 Tax=Catalinimonas alkaloidigena TaxID=1075417 RepID=A0A1G9LRX0_9BACT|nr:hypothetical protein [Catalinimonas alkaloidigena]SDL64524.1 hypothetical protein SAMN05421823_107144 [Catalinimonas alkaloidigena]
MSRKKIRLLFILTGAFLCVQAVVAWGYEEPFPAFVYPRFNSIWLKEDGKATLKTFDLYAFAQGDSIPIDPGELYEDVEGKARRSMVTAFSFEHFPRPGEPVSPAWEEMRAYLFNGVSQFTGRPDIDSLKLTWKFLIVTPDSGTVENEIIESRVISSHP